MKQITKYKSTDGSEWETEAACLERDILDEKIRSIEPLLDCFEEEKGAQGVRKRVDPDKVKQAKNEVVIICRELFPDAEIFKHQPIDEIHPMSYAGSYICDSDLRPIQRIWQRLSCINGEWEYDQPYFALHPGRWS